MYQLCYYIDFKQVLWWTEENRMNWTEHVTYRGLSSRQSQKQYIVTYRAAITAKSLLKYSGSYA
jgi:hypothetical protein